MAGGEVATDGCTDFSAFQIEWSPHARDRSRERRKPRDETESVIRTAPDQQPGRMGRCRIVGCVAKRMTTIIVMQTGRQRLTVISVFDWGKPCK